MTLYTVGFMFDEAGRVLLVRKNRPAWQEGKLNGLGGKVEKGESPHAAMHREFLEEAGVDFRGWELVCAMQGSANAPDPWRVYVFRALVKTFPEDMRSDTDVGEHIEMHMVDNLPKEIIPNLRWIVPLCQETEVKLVGIFG